MKKIMNKVLLACVAVIAVCFLYLKANYNTYLFHAEVQKYITLEPIDLIGTEDGFKTLAKVRVYGSEQSALPGEPEEFSRAGKYHWAYWDWESEEYQNKYESIYGTGLWIYEPAD